MVRQERKPGDVGGRGVGAANRQRDGYLLSLFSRLDVEDQLVVTVSQNTPLILTWPSNSSVELEHVVTRSWTRDIDGDRPLLPITRDDPRRHRRWRVQVVVHIPAIGLVAQLGRQRGRLDLDAANGRGRQRPARRT